MARHEMWEKNAETEVRICTARLTRNIDGIQALEEWLELGWVHPDALQEVKVMLLKAKLKE